MGVFTIWNLRILDPVLSGKSALISGYLATKRLIGVLARLAITKRFKRQKTARDLHVVCMEGYVLSEIDYYIGPYRWRIIKERLLGRWLCRYGYHNMARIARFSECREVFTNEVVFRHSEPFKNRCMRPGCGHIEPDNQSSEPMP